MDSLDKNTNRPVSFSPVVNTYHCQLYMTSYTNALHSDSQTISLFHLYVRGPTLSPYIADLQPLTHLDTLFLLTTFFVE